MKYYKLLIEAVIEENYNKTQDILLLISQEDSSLEYVKYILHFMEENPEFDYGMPGPLVHFVESYYLNGYENILYESISRKPTAHTLWMLNRVLNSSKLIDKEKYVSLMEKVSQNQEVSDIVRQEAMNYLKYQNSKI